MLSPWLRRQFCAANFSGETRQDQLHNVGRTGQLGQGSAAAGGRRCTPARQLPSWITKAREEKDRKGRETYPKCLGTLQSSRPLRYSLRGGTRALLTDRESAPSRTQNKRSYTFVSKSRD